MVGGDQGNSIGRDFFRPRVGQKSMAWYAEGLVDGKLDPAFAVTTRNKVFPEVQ